MPGSKVQEHGGSDKAMVWSCVDFADEEQRMEMFCIRFANAGALLGLHLFVGGGAVRGSSWHPGHGLHGRFTPGFPKQVL